MTISIWKKLKFYILLSHKKLSVNCCHLLKSGLARINWIRAVVKICVEQLICCQKCRANDCWAIAFRAVHPHSTMFQKWFSPKMWPSCCDLNINRIKIERISNLKYCTWEGRVFRIELIRQYYQILTEKK